MNNDFIFKGTPEEFLNARRKELTERLLSDDSRWSKVVAVYKTFIFDIKYGRLTKLAKRDAKRSTLSYNNWLKNKDKEI